MHNQVGVMTMKALDPWPLTGWWFRIELVDFPRASNLYPHFQPTLALCIELDFCGSKKESQVDLRVVQK